MSGEALTHWTIRLALLCLAARLAGALRWSREPWWFPWARGLWTAGCLLFLAHVAAAFHFFHGWSHDHAYRTTAERTYEMLGVRFGEGIYFSYAFGMLWLADVARMWLAPEAWRAQPRWLGLCLLAYLAFIAFNGAVVFEDGVTRWIGAPLSLGLAAAWLIVLIRGHRQRRGGDTGRNSNRRAPRRSA